MKRLVLALTLGAVPLLASAAPAGARVVHLTGGGVVSVTPRPSVARTQPRTTAPPGAHLTYEGGDVLHTNNTVAIFWHPGHSFSSSSARFQSLVDQYLTDVAHDSGMFGNSYSVATQYFDGAGFISNASAFVGHTDDTSSSYGSCTPTPPDDACVTETDIQNEISSQIAAHHIPAATPDTIYFVFLPQHVAACFPSPVGCSDDPTGGFCGIHGSNSHVPFAVILDDPADCTNDPRTPNDANIDPTLSVISHEHIEAITDPYPESGPGWIDETNGFEIGDDCQFDYGSSLGGSGTTAFNQLINSHPYSIQEEWSNADGACVQYDPLLAPAFSTSSAVATQPTAFEATTQRNPHASYGWSFGDGTGALGQTTSHAYPTPGTYTATLTLTTDGGRSASVSQAVAAAIPPPTAAFTLSPPYPRARQRIAFNSGPSRAPFATITGYAWSFGDGGAASGPTPTHKFRRNGDHFVTLTVTTSAGASSAITQRVPIGDPAASFSISGTRRARQRLSFSAKAADPDGHVTHFAWDFGDGHRASGRRASHVFSRAGRYTVALTVTDSDRTRTVVTHRVRIGRAGSHAAAAALARLLVL